MKKNQLKNHFKIFILFFGISLLLLNCEDVQDDSPVKKPSIINEKINFSIIPNGNYTLEKVIDIKQKSNKLQSKSIEDLNLDTQNVLMLQDEGQEFPIYIIDILDQQNNLTNQKLLLRRVENGYYASIFTFITDGEASFAYGDYTGNIIKTNLEDEFIYDVKLNNSVVESVETNSSSTTSKAGGSQTCYATLEYYACPYGYYHSNAECISTGAYYEVKTHCVGGGGASGEDGDNGGGNEGDGGSGTGDESFIPDCTGDECNEECAEGYEKDLLGNCIPICGRNEVRDGNGVCVEETSFPYPHCSSFEYYKPPGSLVTACAVTGLNDTFYAEGERNGVQGIFEVPVNYPLIFFTMPSWRTNGSAATYTAVAVNNAFNATQAWFASNPEATADEVGDKLDTNLIFEMGYFSGSMSAIPPFPLSNPAPYQTSLFNTGNCN